MSRRRDGGAATAEFAVVLPALILVVVAGMAAVSVLFAQLRCVDGAREAARAAARGESDAVVRSAATKSAPTGAGVQVVASGSEVRVTVSAVAGGGGGLLPSFRVTASAVALREPERADGP